MVTAARTAMRSTAIPRASKMGPTMGVLKNKPKLMFGGEIDHNSNIDYASVRESPQVPRTTFLDQETRGTFVADKPTPTERYPLIRFMNE